MKLTDNDIIWLIGALGDYGRQRRREAANLTDGAFGDHLSQTVDRAVAFYEREARRAEMMTDKLKKEINV